MFLPANVPAGRTGWRQLADYGFIPVEGVAQHDRAVLHVAGEYFIVIELRLELLERRLETGDVFEFFLRQLLQCDLRPELSSRSAKTTSKPTIAIS